MRHSISEYFSQSVKLSIGKIEASGNYANVRNGNIEIGGKIQSVVFKEFVDKFKRGHCTCDYKQDLEKEYAIMRKLNHKNVLKAFGIFHLNKFAYGHARNYLLIEPAVEDLYTILIENQIGFVEKMNFSIEICEGMDHIHSRGIVHRDLNPKNILIGYDNLLKICDFGTSKYEYNIGGTICGSPAYVAPEVWEITKDNYDKRVDIYSFGITMWHIFSQKIPHQGINDPWKFRKKMLKIDLRPNINKIYQKSEGEGEKEEEGEEGEKEEEEEEEGEKEEDPPHIEALKRLITRCWATNPEERPSEFSEIFDELQKIQLIYRIYFEKNEKKNKKTCGKTLFGFLRVKKTSRTQKTKN